MGRAGVEPATHGFSDGLGLFLSIANIRLYAYPYKTYVE